MADRRRREDAEATPAADRRKTPRREAARMPVSLWAVEDDGSGIYYHHVRDLSAGGLFLEKGLTLPIGSRMQLELTLPTARSIRAEGVVVTSVQNKTSGNGIRFEKISDADRKAIEDYVLSAAR
jgi:c-di-GMP-binding flagellar brake protein YcgR